MSKVFFSKKLNNIDSNLNSTIKDYFDKDFPVFIKIHFGEPGNVAALTVGDIKPIVEFLQVNWYETVLIDTPVAYPSPRNSVSWYTQVTQDLWYDKISKCLISDNFIKVKMKNFTSKVCKELVEAKNVLVISHVKWHQCAWFGWAIKNLWMWGLMKDTKIAIHGWAHPTWVLECRGCWRCSKACPAWAIKMVNWKEDINLNKCRGCSICQLVCPYGCLKPKVALFDDLLAQWACSCINWFHKQFYINFIIRVAKKCDCEKDCWWIIAHDEWILYSENPIAIDAASLDIINKNNWRNVFKDVNIKDPYLQINFAEKYCNFKKEYDLIDL